MPKQILAQGSIADGKVVLLTISTNETETIKVEPEWVKVYGFCWAGAVSISGTLTPTDPSITLATLTAPTITELPYAPTLIINGLNATNQAAIVMMRPFRLTLEHLLRRQLRSDPYIKFVRLTQDKIKVCLPTEWVDGYRQGTVTAQPTLATLERFRLLTYLLLNTILTVEFVDENAIVSDTETGLETDLTLSISQPLMQDIALTGDLWQDIQRLMDAIKDVEAQSQRIEFFINRSGS